jgi:uncharacterized surface protein with fasciclin (FAS1) repeats
MPLAWFLSIFNKPVVLMNVLFLRRLGQFVSVSFMVLSLMLSGCQKSSTEATPKAVPDLFQDEPQYSVLYAAIVRAGITDQLKAANLTIFAPTNAAFAASGYASAAAVNALPVAAVKDLLLYHVLNGRVLLANVPINLINSPVTTAGGGTAFLSRPTDISFAINGVSVTRADVAVTNGIIHQIDRVLVPSQPSFLAAAAANPNLTYLVAAVNRVVTATPTLAALLSSTSAAGVQATLFAPTNAAFIAAGYRTVADLNAVPVPTLTALLSYHAVGGTIFSGQFQPGRLTTLSNNATITVATSATGVTVKGNQNLTPANVLPAPGRDVPVANGVLHTIDQVLRP